MSDPFAPTALGHSTTVIKEEEESDEQIEDEDEDKSYHALSAYTELRRRYKVISSQRVNGKIIANEADEIVDVQSKTYTEMIKNYGGAPIVIGVNLVMTCFVITSVYGNNVLLEWANQPADVQ